MFGLGAQELLILLVLGTAIGLAVVMGVRGSRKARRQQQEDDDQPF